MCAIKKSANLDCFLRGISPYKMEKTIYQVGAFTEQAFKGNPAGVMILKENLSSKLMQKIASEMNLSETAFVNLSKKPFEIRYFSPTTEVPLCGHATLASAHILYENGLIDKTETINFKSKRGILNVANHLNEIKMIFPKYQVKEIKNIEKFEELIGFSPINTYLSVNDWTIAVAKNEKEIREAKPKFHKMTDNGIDHLIITALSERENIDFVLRCFVPMLGIDEDPVTGSAQCVVVPIWNLKTGKTEFKAEQISERTGKLKVKLIDDKIEITGKATTFFKAEINIEKVLDN